MSVANQHLGALVRSISLSGIFVVFAAVSQACEPVLDRQNDPVTVAGDCSFENAGADPLGYVHDRRWGRPAQDIGNFLVIQRHRQDSGACDTVETLEIVDCRSARVLWLEGEQPTNAVMIGGQSVWKTLDAVLYPTGRFAIRQGWTFDEIMAEADRLDVTVEEVGDYYREASTSVRWDIPDPMCGCRLFYPDSPGARQ